MTLRVVLHEPPLAEMPAGWVLKVYGTDGIDSTAWDHIAKVPGAFIPRSDGPLPATDLWVARYYLKEHRYPKLVCVPLAQQSALRSGLELAGLPFEWEQNTRAYEVPIPAEPQAVMPDGTPYTLSTYQVDAVRDFLRWHRRVISLPVGTGKTVVVMSCAETLFREGLIDRCMIIGSRTVIGGEGSTASDGEDVWLPQLAEFYKRDGVRFDGDARQRTRLAKQIISGRLDPKYVLTSFDLWHGNGSDTLLELLGPGSRMMVAVDEAHHMKNPNIERYLGVRRALTKAPGGPVEYRCLVTGSVAHDKVLDVYGPVQMLGLNVWNSQREFEDAYFNWTQHKTLGGGEYREFLGFSNGGAERLNAVLGNTMFRRSMDQIDLNLPEKTPVPLRVIVSAEEREVYKKIEETIRADLDNAIFRNATRSVFKILTVQRLYASDPAVLLLSKSPTAAKVVEMVGIDTINRITPGAKLRSLCNWLSEFMEGDDGKAVIFTPFEMTQEVAYRLLSDPTVCERNDIDPEIIAKSVWFSGSTKHHHAIREFRRDPKIRILWSTDAGSEGLNYQDVTTYSVHYDDVWSNGTMNQRQGRVWRRGQKRPVFFVRFETDVEQLRNDANARRANSGYIDHRIRRLLNWKGELKNELEAGG